MDIEILLALQEFRTGAGAGLADFFLKMTFLAEMSTVLSYYAVSLILVPMIKVWIPGPVGTLISCFLQMFFVAFLFPWCMVYVEKKVPAQVN